MTKAEREQMKANYMRETIHDVIMGLVIREEIVFPEDSAVFAAALMTEAQNYYEEAVFGYDEKVTADFLENEAVMAYKKVKGL